MQALTLTRKGLRGTPRTRGPSNLPPFPPQPLQPRGRQSSCENMAHHTQTASWNTPGQDRQRRKLQGPKAKGRCSPTGAVIHTQRQNSEAFPPRLLTSLLSPNPKAPESDHSHPYLRERNNHWCFCFPPLPSLARSQSCTTPQQGALDWVLPLPPHVSSGRLASLK